MLVPRNGSKLKWFLEPFVDEHVRDGYQQFDRHYERIVSHDVKESSIGRQQFNGIERKFKVNIEMTKSERVHGRGYCSLILLSCLSR